MDDHSDCPLCSNTEQCFGSPRAMAFRHIERVLWHLHRARQILEADRQFLLARKLSGAVAQYVDDVHTALAEH